MNLDIELLKTVIDDHRQSTLPNDSTTVQVKAARRLLTVHGTD